MYQKWYIGRSSVKIPWVLSGLSAIKKQSSGTVRESQCADLTLREKLCGGLPRRGKESLSCDISYNPGR